MSVVANEGMRFSDVVKLEQWPTQGVCREVVTINQSAATLSIGAVLGATLSGGAAVAAAAAGNTGNGTFGAITVAGYTEIGVYSVVFTGATTFNIMRPSSTQAIQSVIGNGSTGTAVVAKNAGGLGFTITAGGTAFVAGDSFTITVTGTMKYKLVEATATDGSQVAKAIYIGDVNGVAQDLVLANNTDTTALVLARGPAIVAKSNLSYGTSVNSAALQNALYAQLKAVGIYAETVV